MPKTDTNARKAGMSYSPEDIREARAEQAKRNEVPGGSRRVRAFPGQVQARLVDREGRQVYHVEGFATVFERGYEMWDMFGSYKETMDGKSLNKSLGNSPDTAFLVNHSGVTMARTTNGTLEFKKAKNEEGYTGLHIDAYLNPERQDVRDFVSAVSDKLVDEMSFAFMLNDGEWNDDYTEFRIMEADINRGDVSGVNYGANPFTSIAARTAEVLADLKRIPESALGRASGILATRLVGQWRRAEESLSGEAKARYSRAAKAIEEVTRVAGYDGDFTEFDFSDWEIVDETGDDDSDDTHDETQTVVRNGKSRNLLELRYKSVKEGTA